MRIVSARSNAAIAVTLLLVMVLPARPTHACGAFTLEVIFTFTVHPEYPLEQFAAGNLGVLQPSYARSYLYVAYREMLGNEFNEAERKGLVDLWRSRLEFSNSQNVPEDLRESWLAERGKIPGVGPAPKIEVYRNREKPNEYESYLNCPSDAFRSAASTLSARVAKFGLDNAGVKDWVEAQDQVFANCSAGQHLPPAPATGGEHLFVRDRAYQLAAANFYAGNFAEAKRLFKEIAGDSASPWQSAAPYLIARTLVREASLGVPEIRDIALTAAENQFNAILKNQELSRSHEDAKRLLNLVRLRLHPEMRLHELAHSLLNRSQNETLKQQLCDYTILLDQFLGDDAQKKTLPVGIRTDELTDWLITFQSGTAESLNHSLERWQSTSSQPWLISSLTKIHAQHPQAKRVLAAASSIKPESPAFASAAYHSVRLAMEAGRIDEARAKLDSLLQNESINSNRSSMNLILGQRLMLARDLEEFMKYAQRKPAAFSWDDDGRQLPAEASEASNETKSLQGKPLFAADAAELLNQSFPLEMWRQAVDSKTLEEHLHRDVTQAAWLRAVVLNDTRTADAVTPALKAAIPDLKPFLDDYLAAKTPDAKNFSAVYAWLKFPGLEPVVRTGMGRSVGPSKQDSYHDNWWCAAADLAQATSTDAGTSDATAQSSVEAIPHTPPRFLTAAQRAVGRREYLALTVFGAAPNYLSKQVIQWANGNPTDARVPEALHLAVKTTRYGCTDKQTGRWSKVAYDLLHKRYPTSVWAKRTPYWFKGS